MAGAELASGGFLIRRRHRLWRDPLGDQRTQEGQGFDNRGVIAGRQVSAVASDQFQGRADETFVLFALPDESLSRWVPFLVKNRAGRACQFRPGARGREATPGAP